MKGGKKVEEIILTKLDNLETKMDKIATDVIPTLKVEVALLTERTSRSAKTYTLIGGIVAVLTSIGVSLAVGLWK